MVAGLGPLVGRSNECASITRALDGTEPGNVVVAGPPGVGRTRLAREGLRVAERKGLRASWAAATAATAAVPLGALAHLLPPVDGSVDPLVLLQRAVRALSGAPGERPPVLVVDDVHLLDRLSISLLHQLAAGGAVHLLLTVSTSHAQRDPVAPLWKDGVAERLELQPLSREDTESLAEQVLGGSVATRTSEKLWQSSRGNPLVLKEILAEGSRAGLLRSRAGLWHWDGPVQLSERLVEITLAVLGDLDPVESRVLEVVAVAEPVSLDQVVRLGTPEAVASLVRRGVLVEEVRAGESVVRAAHPVYSAVVRTTASTAALRGIRHQLAREDALPESPDALRLRTEVLLAESRADQDPRLLTQAARRANALLDHRLADQLARAGIEAGGGVEAHLALVEAAHWQGEPARSEQLAAEAALIAASEHDQVQLTALRATSLFGLDRAPEAFALLRDAREKVEDDEDRALLVATEACLAFLDGDPERAVHQASSVLDMARSGSIARSLAAAAAAAGLAVAGRTSRALDLVREGWTALATVPDCPQVGFLWLGLAQAEVLALRYDGRLFEVQRRAAELQQANLAAPPWAGDAVIAMYRGCAALDAGRPRAAVRWLVEALDGLDSSDPTGHLPLCISELAMARAILGDVDRARELVNETHGHTRPVLRVFRPQARLAEAWLAAADARIDEAAARALDAATTAAATGQWCVEALMLHTAARFGRAEAVLPRLRQLSEQLDSPLVGVCAAHVDAVAARDGARLHEVSKRFLAMGALQSAGDAMADAVIAHEESGDGGAAAAARAVSWALSTRYQLPTLPGASRVSQPQLTPREEEITRLAARGLTNQEIAQELVLSVRTVETHLAKAYGKLGINSRHSLTELLGGFPDADGPP